MFYLAKIGPIISGRPWHEPEGHEPAGLAAESLVVFGIEGGGFRDRPWFKQPLDENPAWEISSHVVSSGASQ